MIIDGRPAVTARAWDIATGPTPPATTTPSPPPPLPATPAPRHAFHAPPGWGYGQAIEWRFTGDDPHVSGAAQVWTRLRIPLIAGCDITGLARVLVVADSANGLSLALPPQRWLSIPPTMTTTLLRPPTGDWIHLDCRTHLSHDGLGLAHATLRDPGGYLGDVTQPLLIRQR